MCKRDYLVTDDWADESDCRCIVRAHSPFEVQEKYPFFRVLADKDLDCDWRAVKIPVSFRIDIDEEPRGVFAALVAQHREWGSFYVRGTAGDVVIQRLVHAPSLEHVERAFPGAHVLPESLAPVDRDPGLEHVLFDQPDPVLKKLAK